MGFVSDSTERSRSIPDSYADVNMCINMISYHLVYCNWKKK